MQNAELYLGISYFIFLYFFIFAGTTEQVTASVFSGAEKATETVLSLMGMMCLWTGILEVAQRAGITKIIEKLLSPLIRLIFPSLPDGECKDAIAMSMTANF